MQKGDQRGFAFALAGLTGLVTLLAWLGPAHGVHLPRASVVMVAGGALAVITVFSLSRFWSSTDRWVRAVVAACGILAFYLTLATLLSGAPVLSLLGAGGRFVGLGVLLGSIVLAIAVPLLLQRPEQVDTIVVGVGVSIGALAGYGLLQSFGLDPIAWGREFGDRSIGTLGNPNFISAVLAFAWPISLWLWFDPAASTGGGPRRPHDGPATSSTQRRLLGVGLLVLSLAALWTAGSLVGWVAGVAGSAAYALARVRDHRLHSMVAVFVAAVPMGAYLAGIAAVYLGAVGGYTTADFRLAYWQTVTRIWADNPLFGIGPARIAGYYRGYRTPEAAVESGRDLIADSAHSWLFDLAAGGGTPSLIMYGVVLVATGMLLRRAWLAAEGPWHRGSIAVVVGLLGAHGVQASISIPTVTSVWLGWLFIGLAMLHGVNVDVAASRRYGSSKLVTIPVGAVSVLVAAVLAYSLANVMASSSDMGRAGSALRADRPTQAFSAADRTIERTGWWSEAHLLGARAAIQLDQAEVAKIRLTDAHRTDPRSLDAVAGLAQIAAFRGDHDEAAAWYQEALTLDPNGFILNLQVAEWAIETGRLELARNSLETVDSVIDASMEGPTRQYEELQERLRAAE